MAINGVVHSPANMRFGIAEEATFGTAIDDTTGGFIEWTEWDSVSVDYGLTQEIPLRHRTHRLADGADVYTSQTGGVRTVSVSGLVVRRKDLQYLLYGVCQSVSEEAATPWQKTFNVDWTAQPDFSANAGLFFTVALRSQINAYHETFTSCIIKSLALSYDGVGGDGRIKADIEFMTGFPVTAVETYAGTWTVPTQVYVDGHTLTTKSIDSNDAVVYGWDLTINNNAVRVGNTSTGACQTYSIGVGGNGMEVTLNIKTKYDANMQGLKAKYLAGTDVPAILTLGSTGSAGYFHIGLLSAIITALPYEDAEQGQAINVSLQGVYESGNEITFAEAAADADREW